VTFAASADVSVVANRPDRSFGLSPNLVVDRAPAAHSYLRFDLGGLRRRVLRATVRLYAKTGSPAGYVARLAQASTWSERTTWRTAPAPRGSRIASGPVTSGMWRGVDVTRLIKQRRVAGLVLTAQSASRAGGA
jgi:hypothetical protein